MPKAGRLAFELKKLLEQSAGGKSKGNVLNYGYYSWNKKYPNI